MRTDMCEAEVKAWGFYRALMVKLNVKMHDIHWTFPQNIFK